MNTLLVVATGIIVLQMAVLLYRVAAGPTVFDRMLGAGAIGSSGILVLSLLGFIYGRPDMFIDLAIGYALLGFIAIIALAKYFEQRGRVE